MTKRFGPGSPYKMPSGRWNFTLKDKGVESDKELTGHDAHHPDKGYYNRSQAETAMHQRVKQLNDLEPPTSPKQPFVFDLSKLDEPVLPDDYPVYADILYVADGKMIRSDLHRSTVGRLKQELGAKEVRRCDIAGRNGQLEAGGSV